MRCDFTPEKIMLLLTEDLLKKFEEYWRTPAPAEAKAYAAALDELSKRQGSAREGGAVDQSDAAD